MREPPLCAPDLLIIFPAEPVPNGFSARSSMAAVQFGTLGSLEVINAGSREVIIVSRPGGWSACPAAWWVAAVDGWHSVEELT